MTDRKSWRIGFAGFGSVNRALARLLLDRREELSERHRLTFTITLVSSRRRGALSDPAGLDPESLLGDDWRGGGNVLDAIPEAPVDLLFEGTTLDPVHGEPATSHVRAALKRGISVVSANKGPIAFAARELVALARDREAGFRFESSVADCLPVFNLVESALPLGRVESFRGVLNSTSNEVLQAVGRGESIEATVKEMQRRGIAEADPANDLDGWDQAAKAAILANVLLGRDLRPADVERTALSEIDHGWVRSEMRAGRTARLTAAGSRDGPVRVEAISLQPGEFLAVLEGGSLGVTLTTELAGTLHVGIVDPGVQQTAYGMLTDLIAIHHGRPIAPSSLAPRDGAGGN